MSDKVPGLAASAALSREDATSELKRAVAALTRLELAIACLQVAKAEVSVTLGEQNPATQAIVKSLQHARISLPTLQHAVHWLGRSR